MTASTNTLFEQANESLARGDARVALDSYLSIADQHGTSPALAENIAMAAEILNEQGWLEWAEQTALLRNSEWGIVMATTLCLTWALIIAIGARKTWSIKKKLLLSLPCATGILISLWAVDRWMPESNKAIITRATTSTEASEADKTTANILISPFSSAEVIGSLPLGAHVSMTPRPSTGPPENYLYITHPDSQLKGWVQSNALRQVGK